MGGTSGSISGGTGSGIDLVSPRVSERAGVVPVTDNDHVSTPEQPVRRFGRLRRGQRDGQTLEREQQIERWTPLEAVREARQDELDGAIRALRNSHDDAVRWLQGPHSKLAVMAAVELTANFFELLDSLVLSGGDDELDFDTILQYADEECCDTQTVSFLQLSEEVSREIASRSEPSTRREIAAVLAKEDIESSLVREAMLDEVVWMVSNSKATPKLKSNVPQLYEIDGKWVIKYKKTLTGMLDRVRARWVLRGDKQRPYKDFDPHKLYAPVACKTTNLTILAIATQHGLLLFTIDISKAFTISQVDVKELHMRVPDFFDVDVHPDYAPWGADTTWELLTSLYGLKQASARYYDAITKVILSFVDSKGRKFRRNEYDSCCFVKGNLVRGFDVDGTPKTTDYICFSMHVDDKFIAASSVELIREFEGMLKEAQIAFTVGELSAMLGVRISYNRYRAGESGSGTLILDHDQYIQDSFKELSTHKLINQSKLSPLSIPMTPDMRKRMDEQEEPTFCRERYKLFRTVLGKVQHTSQYTHPEISTAVSLVSQRMMNPSDLDLQIAFDILRYLTGTVGNAKATMRMKHCDLYDDPKFTQNPAHLLSDADLSNDPKTRRSRTGFCSYVFSTLTGWKTQKQTQVSLSTFESEYVALSACAQFARWYKGLLADLGILVSHYEPMVILTDSQSALTSAQSEIDPSNKYSRHIENRVKWFKELIRDGTIRLIHIDGTNNIADIFTKVLTFKLFRQFRDKLLHGDRREFRKVVQMCLMQYFVVSPHPKLSIPNHYCTCHNPLDFKCPSFKQRQSLLHTTPPI